MFKIPKSSGISVGMFIMHGFGGGRSEGAEANHLRRLYEIADADILMRGHSHTFEIRLSKISLYVPEKGMLPDELLQRETFRGNWGS